MLRGAFAQSELQAMYAVLRTDMDSAFETQGQLEESKEEVGVAVLSSDVRVCLVSPSNHNTC